MENDKAVKLDDIIEYCDTEAKMLKTHGQSVACAALRRVKEFAEENAVTLPYCTLEETADDGWISVEDRLPDKNQLVMVFYKAIGKKDRIHNDVMATNWRKSNGDFIPCAGYEITHWRPLPEPPKGV